MACRLFGAKPLPEPMLAYCQLDPWEQVSVKFESEFHNFHSRKCIWKCRLPKWRPFCPGGYELMCRATYRMYTSSFKLNYITCKRNSDNRRCSGGIWVINNDIAYKGASYIGCLTVFYKMTYEWFSRVLSIGTTFYLHLLTQFVFCNAKERSKTTMWCFVIVELKKPIWVSYS